VNRSALSPAIQDSASVALPAPRRERVASSPTVRSERKFWRRFKRNRLALAGSVILVLQALLALVGPIVAPHDPYVQDGARRLLGPSAEHWLGTDDLGRDILSRLLHGARISIVEGVVIVAISMLIGVPLGAIAAYFRRLENVIMRPLEILLAFPGMLLALGLVAIMGPGLLSVLLAVGISGIPSNAILTRSLVLGVQHNEYVLAARAIGSGDQRILLRHVLPNCLSPLIVQASFRVGLGILIAASLSFLGLGAQPPMPEWGAMLSNGRDFLYRAPHVATFPGLALGLTTLGFNLLGDGLRDMLDPRLRA
jgi:peptide/nickel transport system permease protein